MTKKDYQAIARAIYQAQRYEEVETGFNYLSISLISALGDIFKAGNNAFDFARFKEACLTGKCKGMKS